jgi:hypothetical protein
MSNKPTPRPRTIRCAIYTRRSTEEGLDQEKNQGQALRWKSTLFGRSAFSLFDCLSAVSGHGSEVSFAIFDLAMGDSWPRFHGLARGISVLPRREWLGGRARGDSAPVVALGGVR